MPDVLNDDDMNALAAEYVLGSLDVDERLQAQSMLDIDHGFRAMVRIWERRFGELHLMVEPVEPGPQVWERIKARMPPPIPVEAPAAAVAPIPTPDTGQASQNLATATAYPMARPVAAAIQSAAPEPPPPSPSEATPPAVAQESAPATTRADTPAPTPISVADLAALFPGPEKPSSMASLVRRAEMVELAGDRRPGPDRLPGSERVARAEAGVETNADLSKAVDKDESPKPVLPSQETVGEAKPAEAPKSELVQRDPGLPEAGAIFEIRPEVSRKVLAMEPTRAPNHDVGIWRAIAIVMTVVSAILAATVGFEILAPDLLPSAVRPSITSNAPGTTTRPRGPVPSDAQFDE
jgi:anti-sigma-K factor RskA